MKKFYLSTFFLCLGFWITAQTIVVVDRENVETGSSPTANATGVSSTGFTRSNVTRTTNNANHTSNGWDSTSSVGAILANEYIEWSVTAGSTFTVTLDELDIRLRRNNNGPAFYQILYSTDGFVGNIVDLTGVQNTPTTVSSPNFLIPSVSTTGTVTFRLFAWHDAAQANQTGWLRFQRNGAWSDLGNTNVAARIIGSAVSSSPNSIESDIVRSSSFNEPENIDYVLYNTNDNLGPANAIKIGEFIIRDGGDTAPDADSEPTILSSIEFAVVNSNYIEALAIYAGGVAQGETEIIGDITTIGNLNSGNGISAPDDGSTTIDVYATFTSNVVDKEQFQLTISGASTPSTGSSLFEQGNAGGAQTSITGDANRLDVIATSLLFIQQPTDVSIFEPITPAIEAIAVDENANIDMDYNDIVSLFSDSNELVDGPVIQEQAEEGFVIFHNVRFKAKFENADVTIFADGILNETSSAFDILDPFLPIAVQDFSGSCPEWSYTNNIAFFDNGWGNGYYGPIDISAASPLDFELFSGEILGENKLNDTGNGNGTTGRARLTFANVDVSGVNNVKVTFDWQVVGYEENRNDLRYAVRINGTWQPWVTLFDGNFGFIDGKGHVVIDIPDGTNTVGLRIDTRNWLDTGYSGVDNVRVVTQSPDVLVYFDNEWFPNDPTATPNRDLLIRRGDYVVGAPIETNNIFISPGASVSVDPGQTVQTNGSLCNSGSFIMNSTSALFSSFIPQDVDNNGTISYNRFVNNASIPDFRGNDLISFPLIPATGLGFDEFLTLGSTANASKLFEEGGVYRFGIFDGVTSSYLDFPVDATANLEAGIGYRAGTNSGDNLTFEGDIITTDVTGITVSKPAGGSQWNLLGNPYPSYLNSLDFIAANEDVFDPTGVAIYGYNAGTGSPSGTGTLGNFTVVNSVTNGDVNVAPGQGFLIPVQFVDGYIDTVDFTADMRTLVGDDDFILSRFTSMENLNFRLAMSNGDEYRTMDMYFHDNGSDGLDVGYDAMTFGDDLGDFNLYSMLVDVDGNADKTYLLQTLHNSQVDKARVPLGVEAKTGERLEFYADFSNLPQDIEVYLEDTKTKTFVLLNNESYNLVAQSDISGTGRFYLNFGSNNLSNEEVSLEKSIVFASVNKQIHINGNLPANTEMRLFDINGRQVMQQILDANITQRVIDAKQLEAGIYIVSLTNSDLSTTTKIILR